MAGTDRSRVSPGGGPRIILLRPQMAENIGAAARAMLNCGLDDLTLVNPRDPWPDARAWPMASGANGVLERAVVRGSLRDAVADLSRVYAMTARPRELRARVLSPRAAAAEMRAAQWSGARIGVVFGPERSGLANDDLVHADTIVTAPLNPGFASLNLAQAVFLIGYEWYLAGAERPDPPVCDPPVSKVELAAFLDRLEAAVAAGGFFKTEELRPTMARNLRVLFQRAGLTGQDVRTLHGVVSALLTAQGRE